MTDATPSSNLRSALEGVIRMAADRHHGTDYVGRMIAIEAFARAALENSGHETKPDALLRKALQELLDHYVGLINSGDAGNWDPEQEREVVQARAALRLSSNAEKAATWECRRCHAINPASAEVCICRGDRYAEKASESQKSTSTHWCGDPACSEVKATGSEDRTCRGCQRRIPYDWIFCAWCGLENDARNLAEKAKPRREYHANGTYWSGVPTVDMPCDFCHRPITDHDPRTHACKAENGSLPQQENNHE